MSRFSRLVSVFALLLGSLFLAGMSTATAAGSKYPGDGPAPTVTVKVTTDCGKNCAAKVSAKVTFPEDSARVSARAAAPRSGTQGDLKIILDGDQIKSIPIDSDKESTFKLSCKTVEAGDHNITGRFVPAEGTSYKAASDSKDFTVNCGAEPQGRVADDSGLLPTTGGPWIGLAAIAALLLAAGAYLARRTRKS